MIHNTEGKNRRILIIDDNQAIHEDFRKILVPENALRDAELDEGEAALFGTATGSTPRFQFELDSAHQGQEGVRLVEQALEEGRPYAVAFVDVRMPPGIDGVETTRRIYDIDPEVQIVICTAYSDYSWDEMYAQIGDRDGLVILKKPFDTVEVLQLAFAFTEKWWLHREAQLKMEDLEHRVAERTSELHSSNLALQRREQQLSIQYAVSRVLATTVSEEQAEPRILQTLCEGFGWDVGALWRVDFRSEALRWAASWNLSDFPGGEFDELNRTLAFARGAGLPGRVWLDGKSAWIPDLAGDPNFPRAREAERLGLHSGVAFPILNRNDVCGVIEMFSRKPREPDQAMAPVFGVLGEQIGQYIERKTLEEKLFRSRKLETVGKLAGGVANEFNSILTAISGQSELLLTDLPADSPLCANVIEIRKAADRAATLTRQLLAYGRKQFMRKSMLDLNKELRDMEGMLRRLIGAGIDLRVSFAPDLPMVEADEGQIEEVIVSLAMNAADAMPNGGTLTLETSAVTLDRDSVGRDEELVPGDYVVLAVSDTGMGMCVETRARVFEPFFTTKGVGKGSGLGLSTCYGIVKQSGGHLSVYSEPGRGSTFRVFLPQAPVKGKVKRDVDSVEKMPGGKETILLVEDDAALRGMAEMVLKRLGYRVLSASDGASALEIAADRDGDPIHLLLTDVVMPDIDGCELSRRMIALYPDTKLVFTSAFTEKVIDDRKLVSPGAGLLQKPFTASALARKVRDALDG